MESVADTVFLIYCHSESESQQQTWTEGGGGGGGGEVRMSACEIAGDFVAPRISRSSL